MRLRFFVPLVLFVLLAVAFAVGLTLKPRDIPSALIGQPVPEFDLPPLPDRELGFASADLRRGEVSLVNVFASWCVPCQAEHALFVKLNQSGQVPIFGINYRDKPDDAIRWLKALGDPYTQIGADFDTWVSIDWGVYGVPETFVVDGNGTILLKHVGQVTEDILIETILPLVETTREQAAASRAKQ
jgi:cytochrome c biogenesis protein CcmG/thiol:disulfide interchange protein DsbE